MNLLLLCYFVAFQIFKFNLNWCWFFCFFLMVFLELACNHIFSFVVKKIFNMKIVTERSHLMQKMIYSRMLRNVYIWNWMTVSIWQQNVTRLLFIPLKQIYFCIITESGIWQHSIFIYFYDDVLKTVFYTQP